MTNERLRPYGPGKFDTMLDSFVYELSLDGCDEEAGDVNEQGMWYGIIRGVIRLTAPLTPAEREIIQGCVGVILSEDSDGFVHVEYYRTKYDLNMAWSEVEQWEQASDVPEERDE